MALSKSTRIILLLIIDTTFFLVEISIGYATHSLALVADAFHMLNDVLSLCVGYWAVKVANQKTDSKTYTYGWQRAETLGALVNGVFLVALCVTIFLDAIGRFFEGSEVSSPMLMVIVGSVGLASNLVGLVLFHDHSHGPGEPSHGGVEGAAEEGHAHAYGDEEDRPVADQSGNVADILPETRVAGYQSTSGGGRETTAVDACSPLTKKSSSNSRVGRTRKHSRSQSRVFSGVDDIPVAPNAFRKSIIDASRQEPDLGDWEGDEEVVEDGGFDTHSHQQPLLNGGHSSYGAIQNKSIRHENHNNAKPKDSSGEGGHSNSDLNMKGIFLHVMGDALGNIGVIAAGAFIWKTSFSWRMYSDPAISLIITIIILCSAIPLCKAASRILLQAVPPGIDLDHIKEDIEDLPGIVSCHHLHVWQLSDTKLVSSLHVQVDFDFKGEGSARYMELAQAVRKCLHEYGIHSSTIQPEFCLDPEHDHGSERAGGDEPNDRSLSPPTGIKRSGVSSRVPSKAGSRVPSKAGSRVPSKAGSMCEQTCLLECPDERGGGKGCCDPKPNDQEDGGSSRGHGHAH